MRTVKMNKVVIAELFDKVISSAIKTEKLLAENGINMSELRKRNVIRINKSYKQIIYTNGELLPKGMEAHIIALINGALS
jgi:hypothetical protein